jgi:hypothetical protein
MLAAVSESLGAHPRRCHYYLLVFTSDSSEGSEPDELTDMYAPGCGSIGMARLTEEQVRLLRKQGMVGGHGTVSVTGSKAPPPAMSA